MEALHTPQLMDDILLKSPAIINDMLWLNLVHVGGDGCIKTVSFDHCRPTGRNYFLIFEKISIKKLHVHTILN